MKTAPAPFSPARLPGEARRAVLLLSAATAVGSLGLAAGGTAAALLAVAMTGSEAAAGLPLGALAAGQAAASLLVGRLTSRSGRGAGLVLGYGLGVLGAVTVVVAAATGGGSAGGGGLLLMLAGSAFLGGANAAVFLSRYAAADLVGPGARGRALGAVLSAATVGTIAGPVLLVPAAGVAQTLGLPHLTGLYLVAVLAFGGAGVAVAALSRGPRAAVAAAAEAGDRPPVSRTELAAALRQPPVRAALVTLGATNLVMVAIMAVTPVLLLDHGHHLGFVGLAISVHVLGMFAPSPVTGWLADRFGGARVAVAGAVLLGLAAAGGAVVDHTDAAAMVGVLVVLGLGWNFGVVGGSALLAASVPARLRPRSEGIGEASMGLAAAAGAPAAGLLVALGGYTTLCLAGMAVGTLVLLAGVGRSGTVD